ncbi:hypothetical protein FHX44_11190 [Pseudonocardia hierapolitana]|uniref:Uncharacterized protein n=1 Tax=Pseudonocardia hierapolitana TaxID=1128676 RepID=A0A561SHG9_9PSEU|nr:hypothetical protein [Pseudonocardia hierapolitana]TWF74311.1 hypothetical protein FHX44_11190 [Pseudonocardia hierapolitana]
MPDAPELNFDPFDRMLLTADGIVTSLPGSGVRGSSGHIVAQKLLCAHAPGDLQR